MVVVRVVEARRVVQRVVQHVADEADFLREHVELLLSTRVEAREHALRIVRRRVRRKAAACVEVLINEIVALPVRGDRGELRLERQLVVQLEADIADVVRRLFRRDSVRSILVRAFAVPARVLRRNVAAVPDPVPVEEHGEALGRLEEQLGVERVVVDATAVVAVQQILRIAVLVLVRVPNAQREGFCGEGNVRDRLHLECATVALAVVVAVGREQARIPLAELRLAAAHDDRSAGRVAAPQNRLRAAVDLDRLDVEGVDQLARAGRHKHAIEHDADVRDLGLLDVRIAEAADVDRARARAGGVHADEHVRREAVEIAQRAGRERLDRLLPEMLDRDRNVLNRLFAQARGHDDLFDAGFCGRGRRCRRGVLRPSDGRAERADSGQRRDSCERLSYHGVPQSCFCSAAQLASEPRAVPSSLRWRGGPLLSAAHRTTPGRGFEHVSSEPAGAVGPDECASAALRSLSSRAVLRSRPAPPKERLSWADQPHTARCARSAARARCPPALAHAADAAPSALRNNARRDSDRA